MTRLGWTILAAILLGAGLFASMLSFGPAERKALSKPPPPVAVAEGGNLVIPVAGHRRGALVDSWGDARGGGTRGHRGLDIMAPAGTRVVAAGAGTVEKLFQSRLGGTTLYIRSPDRRWIHYYAHLAGYAPGLREGMRVRAGQWVGLVGDTGDAGAGNHHLHFAMQRMRPDQRWWEGEDVNPYPLLAGNEPARY